jgi:hypothetical protein
MILEHINKTGDSKVQYKKTRVWYSAGHTKLTKNFSDLFLFKKHKKHNLKFGKI